jgi:hypothetical protein
MPVTVFQLLTHLNQIMETETENATEASRILGLHE